MFGVISCVATIPSDFGDSGLSGIAPRRSAIRVDPRDVALVARGARHRVALAQLVCSLGSSRFESRPSECSGLSNSRCLAVYVAHREWLDHRCRLRNRRHRSRFVVAHQLRMVRRRLGIDSCLSFRRYHRESFRGGALRALGRACWHTQVGSRTVRGARFLG